MTSGFKIGVIAAAALAAAAICASGPGAAAEARPSPTLFKGGTCLTDACARDRWVEFLAARGAMELPLSEDALRLTEWGGPPCAEAAPSKPPGRILHLALSRPYGVEIRCGQSTPAAFTPTSRNAITAQLAKPEVSRLDGPYPAYCKEGDDDDAESSDPQASVLEVVQGGRYRLIEWDCDRPAALASLIANLQHSTDANLLPVEVNP